MRRRRPALFGGTDSAVGHGPEARTTSSFSRGVGMRPSHVVKMNACALLFWTDEAGMQGASRWEGLFT